MIYRYWDTWRGRDAGNGFPKFNLFSELQINFFLLFSVKLMGLVTHGVIWVWSFFFLDMFHNFHSMSLNRFRFLASPENQFHIHTRLSFLDC